VNLIPTKIENKKTSKRAPPYHLGVASGDERPSLIDEAFSQVHLFVYKVSPIGDYSAYSCSRGKLSQWDYDRWEKPCRKQTNKLKLKTTYGIKKE
jgi:hypothetical protein